MMPVNFQECNKIFSNDRYIESIVYCSVDTTIGEADWSAFEN